MTRAKYEARIHHIVSLIGGFLGAYAIISRTSNFGSAETINMIAIVIGLMDNNFEAYIFRLLALVLYISAIIFTVALPKLCKVNIQYLSMAIDAIGMIILAFMPIDFNPIIALFPVFFMSAFQWNSFSQVNGYNCSTIFSTNNLRQMIIGFTEYIANKKPEYLARGKFFGVTLIYYHLGVVYAFIVTKIWGIKASVAGIVPVIVATTMLIMYGKKIKNI